MSLGKNMNVSRIAHSVQLTVCLTALMVVSKVKLQRSSPFWMLCTSAYSGSTTMNVPVMGNVETSSTCTLAYVAYSGLSPLSRGRMLFITTLSMRELRLSSRSSTD